VLTEVSGGRAVAVPALERGVTRLHPLGPDLRLLHRPSQGLAVCQRRLGDGWRDLPEVAVEPRPGLGFALDAAALRRAVDRLDPELDLALPGG
jgi:hypothetical protein